MKVICAGLSKTGTKSMNAALTKLGYKVYDYFENLEYLQEEWRKIINGEAGTELLMKMYQDVDATCDMPIYCYWEHILEAFPDAQVILTVRDSDEAFYKSMYNQIKSITARTSILPKMASPTYRRFTRWNMDAAQYGMNGLIGNGKNMGEEVTGMLMRQVYRRHNAYVKQRCPEEQLLVFNCKDGWEPLCSFLGVPTPKEPFPHKNIKGDLTNTLMECQTFKQIKREVTIFLASIPILLCGVALLVWQINTMVSY